MLRRLSTGQDLALLCHFADRTRTEQRVIDSETSDASQYLEKGDGTRVIPCSNEIFDAGCILFLLVLSECHWFLLGIIRCFRP